MAHYEPVDGVYRKVAKHYEQFDGAYRNVIKAYYPVDGVYREYFGGGGTPISTLAVGDSVWLNVNGSLKEFLVVHQGNPDSALYDESCNGTWLLMKDIYKTYYWAANVNDYVNSIIHTELNDTILSKFDAQSAIKQVKIPAATGGGLGGSVVSGSSGLSTKIFLLSFHEVGGTPGSTQYVSADGACLDYFSGTSGLNAKRIAYYNATATNWYSRSVGTTNNSHVWFLNNSGEFQIGDKGKFYGIRPALILYSSTPIDNSTGINIIA
jgi:hypothetical protein